MQVIGQCLNNTKLNNQTTRGEMNQVNGCDMRPIYIGKNQNLKNLGFFVVPFTLPEKPITFQFLARKEHARKNQNLTLVFW